MNEPSKQIIANKKWQEKNKECTKYSRNRTTARTFITKDSLAEGLLELERLIAECRATQK